MTAPDLTGRIADRLRTHQWYDNPAFPILHEPSAHGTHEGVGFTTDCAICMKRVDRIAAVAAQVAAEQYEQGHPMGCDAAYVQDPHQDPARLRGQLAEAHADCARYATERDEARAERDKLVHAIGRLTSLSPKAIADAYEVGYAQEPGAWMNRRAVVSDALGRALTARGYDVPLPVRDRCAEAVLAAQDAARAEREG